LVYDDDNNDDDTGNGDYDNDNNRNENEDDYNVLQTGRRIDRYSVVICITKLCKNTSRLLSRLKSWDLSSDLKTEWNKSINIKL